MEKHLTNHAVTKKSENYVAETGNKWSVAAFRQWALSNHGPERTDACFGDIQSVMIKSLIACQDMIVQDRHCFELYGFDIMVDRDLKAWLIEVNAQPSLSADTDQDRVLKLTIVSDVLDVLETQAAAGREKVPILHMGGLDAVILDDKPVKVHPTLKSLLGCSYPTHKNAYLRKNDRKSEN